MPLLANLHLKYSLKKLIWFASDVKWEWSDASIRSKRAWVSNHYYRLNLGNLNPSTWLLYWRKQARDFRRPSQDFCLMSPLLNCVKGNVTKIPRDKSVPTDQIFEMTPRKSGYILESFRMASEHEMKFRLAGKNKDEPEHEEDNHFFSSSIGVNLESHAY